MVDDRTFAAPDAKARCDQAAMHFAVALAGYRTCLLRSSEGAIARGNDALFAYRCRSGQSDRCGQVSAGSGNASGPAPAAH